MYQNGLHRIAHRRARTLGVFDNIERHILIALGVDKNVAYPFVVLDHRNRGVAHHFTDQRLAAARNYQVNILIHGKHLIHRLAAYPRNKLNRPFGQTGGFADSGHNLRQLAIGVNRLFPAAQDNRIAGLETYSGGVNRNIGTGLIDDADNPDRHRNFVDHQSVRTGNAGEHPADHFILSRHLTQTVGHSLDSGRCEFQPFQFGFRESVGLSFGHIYFVGF